MIRVLIAEDSPSIQRILAALLSDQEDIEVVGVAKDGLEAVEMCRELRPDLVTMDIFMPRLDGLEATQRIMREFPTRIVLVSSIVDSQNLKNSFEAIRSGAVELIKKPHGALSGNYSEVRDELIRVVRKIMQAQPIKQLRYSCPVPPRRPEKQRQEKKPLTSLLKKSHQRIFTAAPSVICIGGSTGAPAVLATILSSLSPSYPVPMVIAQHIASGFIRGMVEWLDSIGTIEVRIAREGDFLRPATALVAPDNSHLQIESMARVRLIAPSGNETYVPSIDQLFESAAASFGSNGLGVILSGMGSDGCSGLAKMRSRGAVTIAQSERSSVVYGMPMVAYKQGAAVAQMDPLEIIDYLEKLAR
ncbi:MAG: chemotaxis-specific protein-glutamate methyltransferase CheB [Deltaproteobacteria bacterium]|nr:chemotaxis-specific protein-glutamate methyltransferase CheB [Deltaproteobacteria bacterium]